MKGETRNSTSKAKHTATPSVKRIDRTNTVSKTIATASDDFLHTANLEGRARRHNATDGRRDS